MQKKALIAPIVVGLLPLAACASPPPLATPLPTSAPFVQFATTQAATLTPTPTPVPVSNPDLVASVTAAAVTLTPGALSTPLPPTPPAVEENATAQASTLTATPPSTPVPPAFETSTAVAMEMPTSIPSPTPG